MEKNELLQTLKHISDSYFQKKDYISAGQINLAIDVAEDYYAVLQQSDVRKSICTCKKSYTEEEYSDNKCTKCDAPIY